MSNLTWNIAADNPATRASIALDNACSHATRMVLEACISGTRLMFPFADVHPPAASWQKCEYLYHEGCVSSGLQGGGVHELRRRIIRDVFNAPIVYLLSPATLDGHRAPSLLIFTVVQRVLHRPIRVVLRRSVRPRVSRPPSFGCVGIFCASLATCLRNSRKDGLYVRLDC